MIGNGTAYPNIPLARLEEMLADLRTRYDAYGSNEHPYWQTRRDLYYDSGRIDEAEECNVQVRKLKPAELSDCKACDLNLQVRLAVTRGKHAVAIKRAKPILAGKLSCATIRKRLRACC